MTEQRPQYGEYATPEEQRRLAGLPPADVPPPPVSAPPAPVPESRPAPTRRVDMVATIALLAYGLVNVIMTGISYLDLPTVLEESMTMLGIDAEFTNISGGKMWGTVAAIVLAIGWTLTALLSLRRLRRGKLTWWLPLVGAAVTMFATSLCIVAALAGDPGFLESVSAVPDPSAS